MTVKQIQHLLAYLGYYTLDVDGISGPGTLSSVKAFQKDFGGLQVDGIAGNETQKALTHAVAYGIDKSDEPEESNSQWVGKNFSHIEFACPCPRCGGFPKEPSETLVRLADQIRDHFGSPMIITSGVRCQAHNDELPGSAKNSYHIRGKAMDFYVSGKTSSQVLSYVNTIPHHYTYAIDSNCVHVDVE